ncbi:Putative peptidoglycan lipid II flippase MurJ [Rhodovulum sp. PH10]|uniref:murein biosynthesis integral membrane protein MurJ n=1 Tax=Rhodovulum sp. PH10 TaxID=1187851 RepID=UPI00027C1D7D|nr:murein biosynthesis integral membrane protein MurJ [Rhodovulum sp. PH10]EJW13645.1 Putative peptidoglycan lipid II flippase MurJ [Rhodovulum sp. PH10]
MLGRIFTVGGLTLLSRVTGFLRDIMLAAVLGAGPIADAFFVALRLPNHFRAIFAEGAFNAAFVPAYARVRQQGGPDPARLFADRVFTMLVAAEAVLLVLALVFTPTVIRLLAPGFADDPGRFALAVDLTRITFPYLLLVSLVTLYGGMLNAVQRFASPAAAPILLNLSMMATLSLAVFFPSAGHAAAWGVFIAGILEVLLVGADTARRTGLPRFARFSFDEDVKKFFKALGPATIGSAGMQIALFADTIIASFLAAGALSALYYADRLNQLPIGVIGIAVGTVILPEMANRLAAGDTAGARDAQSRAIELTLVLSVPCLVAFLLVPDLIMLALFSRGAFTAADAAAAGATLRAYTIGLLPFVLIRSLTATFLARGDTATPVKALLAAVVVNVGFKIFLMGPLAQVGLALATSIGAWVNFLLVVWFARRAGFFAIDRRMRNAVVRLTVAGLVLAAALFFGEQVLDTLLAGLRTWRHELTLLSLALIGAVAYGAAVALLFGRQILAGLRRRRGALTPAPAPTSAATAAVPPGAPAADGSSEPG